MSPVTEGIFIGVGSAIILAFLSWIASAIYKFWLVPLRIEKIEGLIPLLLEGMMMLSEGQAKTLKCVAEKTCNGDLEEHYEILSKFKAKVQDFIAKSVVEKK